MSPIRADPPRTTMTKSALVSFLLACVAATACGSKPESAEEHLLQAMMLTTDGEPARAMHHYDEAVRLEPNNADVYVTRGVAHHMNGDIASTIADYEKAIELEPALESGLAMQLEQLRTETGR